MLESDPPRRLTISWNDPTTSEGTDSEQVTFDIEAYAHDGAGDRPAAEGGIVRLTVTHENFTGDAGSAAGWPAVLSNLKSFLETGRPLSRIPWEMP